ncbi:MAG: hypothetical protein ACREP7_12580 [Lysobacter sp.]
MTAPKTECEQLMNVVLPFAEQTLQKYGGFHPYGAALKTDGEVALVAGYDGNEHPPSTEIIRLINQGFVNSARLGEYKATALVYDVTAVLPSSGQTSDAIAVSLNHRQNYSVVMFFPYRLSEGAVQFGEAFAEAGKADVFV